MKEYIKSLPSRMRQNRSINVLAVGLMLFFAIVNIINGEPRYALTTVATLICYLLGGGLGGIKKYLPIVFASISIAVFLVAAIIFAATHQMPAGFSSYAMVVLLFSMVAFVNTRGKKCVPYGLVMAGAGCVFTLGLNDNGMVIWIGALAITIMLADSTYTAMSKYVLSLFIWAVTVKCVGLLFFVNKMELTGIVEQLSKNAYVFVALVVLGFLSLLLRERHPRIKSDRDKKHLPALRQWQIVAGITFIFLYIWSVISFSDLFAVHSTEYTTESANAFIIAMLYSVVYYNTAAGSLLPIITNYGFVILLLTTATMVCFIYRAYEDHKLSKEPSDLSMLLILFGFMISFVCSKFNIPVLLLYGLFAGCMVNGRKKEAQ